MIFNLSLFFGGGNSSATSITFQDIDGPEGDGTLMLGNMIYNFNFNGNNENPVSIVWDADGLIDALDQGAFPGDRIAATNADFACDTNTSCATPATNDMPYEVYLGPGQGLATYTVPIGASPFVTTTWNTTDIGTVTLGTNPSGTLPLIADTIGGSPMKAGVFPGFNINFDFDSMEITDIYETPLPVPVPASVWLFGSGVLGLIGITRRKKT